MRERQRFLRTMAFILTVAASTTGLAVPSRCSDRGSATQVLEREHQYSAALLHGDARLLAGVLADSFVDTSQSGALRDKQQLLALVARERPPASIAETDRRIQVYGDAAVVTVKFKVKGSDGGKPYEFSGRATDVWIYRAGRWECVAAHSSGMR
ncbi:MAG TPA: nuclear transport factor 2 family protein [Steroidobacteraceae bacterium]|nr:nuclear transport factor 2 family protein [Steroidobacteraceae bacterium]